MRKKQVLQKIALIKHSKSFTLNILITHTTVYFVKRRNLTLVLFIFDKRFFSQLFAQFIHETDNEPTCLPCADRRINTIAILKWWTLKRHFDKARDYALFTLRTFI